MSALCLHAGAKQVTLDDVRAMALPDATRTWAPVAHDRVLSHVRDTLDAAGYAVTREQLALNRHGQQFFAVLDLARPIGGDGASLAIGIRNSIDKSFPMGMVGGSRVSVCDNLAFSSDLIDVRRKHTRYGERRFAEAIAGAVGKLPSFELAEAKRMDTMRSARVSADAAELLALRSAIDWNLLPLRDVPAVIQECRRPTFAAHYDPEVEGGAGVSLWRLWNAYTHVLRGAFESAPGRAALLTMRLQRKLIDAVAPEVAQAV